MNIGDLVMLRKDGIATPLGVIVAPDPCGWWWVLSDWGEKILWPAEETMVVNS